VTVGWLIRALGEADEGEHLFDVYTRPDWDGWAKNLAKGATCTWESWDADSGGNLSLSHPWGAVGLCGLQQYVLGVRPLAPQYEEVLIKPLSFGPKLRQASGTVPTDRGDIGVSWERIDGRFRMAVTLPVNVQARVYLPPCGHAGETVRVDAREAAGNVEGDYIAVDGIGSGVHTFERL
jgi:alpha-L-rhamnosidase